MLKLRKILIAAVLLGACSAVFSTEELNYSGTTLDGKVVDLSQLRGQWVLVNFWATWCKPCRKEIPELDQLHQEIDDLTVVGLAMDESSEEEIASFAEQLGATYPIVQIDAYEPPKVFGMPRILPTTLVIDADGKLVETISGEVTYEQIKEKLGLESS